jgi:hypothetical protein
MSHGDKPSGIEKTTYDLCFGDPLDRRLQKLVGNDKLIDSHPDGTTPTAMNCLLCNLLSECRDPIP